MRSLGNFKCPQCSHIYSGISQAEALVAVIQFNEHFAGLSPAKQAEFGGQPAVLEMYEKCGWCSTPAANFVPAPKEDTCIGRTLQVVIAPTVVKERGAISPTSGRNA